MDPVSSSVEIDRSPQEIFAYLVDVANLPEWAGAVGEGWLLTREDTVGRGAGLRFSVKQRAQRYPWMDLTIMEADPGRRIVLAGRGGKFNRIRYLTTITLEATEGRKTRVSLQFEGETKLPTDRLFDRKGYFKSRWRKALKDLERTLEGGRVKGERATIAGGPRKPATGASVVAAEVALSE